MLPHVCEALFSQGTPVMLPHVCEAHGTKCKAYGGPCYSDVATLVSLHTCSKAYCALENRLHTSAYSATTAACINSIKQCGFSILVNMGI